MLDLNVKKIFPKWLLATVIIFFILIFAVSLSLFLYGKVYRDKIYQGVVIGELNLGGLSIEEAKQIINQRIDNISQAGTTFYYQNQEAKIFPLIASPDGSLAYQIIHFYGQEAAEEAFAFGRQNNFFINCLKQLRALIFKKQLQIKIELQPEKIIKNLQNQLQQFEQPAENAKLVIINDDLTDETSIEITQEKYGKIMDYKTDIRQLEKQLAVLNNSAIEIKSKTDYPKIYKSECLNIYQKTKNIISLQPLIFKYNNRQWLVDKENFLGWLVLTKNSEKSQDVLVSFDKQKVMAYLEETVEPEINQEPINAKFEINNGRVTEFQASQNGYSLNKESTFTELKNIITQNKLLEINLVVEKEESYITTENINDFGIKEIIGTGHSNFTGSPANRRHNIRTGANSLSGLLIEPNQEFSLNKALGTIDASTGYLPELVIKDNETIPEYGGGLCQIGTTLFRTVLQSGLPVTMRRNHSYRVSYYEPAGTDATIYDPWPDFRFINDTGNYILIQSRIISDDIYFDFWGEKDGRTVELTDPTIYNIVKPEPTKYIETLDLPVGEKKCTEHAHNGADAYFDYKVIYQNKEIKEERFQSHYVPWREVCLIGVEKLSEPEQTEEGTATSTEETTEEE